MKFHLQLALVKRDAQDRTEAALMAVRDGLVRLKVRFCGAGHSASTHLCATLAGAAIVAQAPPAVGDSAWLSEYLSYLPVRKGVVRVSVRGRRDGSVVVSAELP